MGEGSHQYRLPPRLPRSGDFREARHFGKHFRLAFLHLIIRRLPRNRDDIPESQSRNGRVGFVVSEKAVRLSVNRNRVKRLLKEAVRLWWGNMQSGHDLLLSVNGLPKLDHGLYVESVFVRLLLEAGILTKSGKLEAEKKLESIPPDFREKGSVKCDR